MLESSSRRVLQLQEMVIDLGCYASYVSYVSYASAVPQVQEMPPRVCTLRVSLEGKTPTGAGLKV